MRSSTCAYVPTRTWAYRQHDPEGRGSALPPLSWRPVEGIAVNGKVWAVVVATVVTALVVSIAVTALGIPAEVCRNTADLARHEVAIREMRADISEMREDLSEMKGDIKYIRNWVADQKPRQ